jgi:hypothetical protein
MFDLNKPFSQKLNIQTVEIQNRSGDEFFEKLKKRTNLKVN